MIYEFHPDAEEEFIDAAAYYEENVPGLGERFAREVHQAIEQLLNYPEIGSPIDPNLRRIVMPRFPYCLIYSFTSDILSVIAVAHTRRRPGYWRLRGNR
jgi:plasmid stabilization system protein ParE